MKIMTPNVGCGLRLDVYQETVNNFDTFQILEVMVDHYLAAGLRTKKLFTNIQHEVPFILHGVGLSIGSVADPDPHYLQSIAQTIQTLKPLAYTEHLAFTKAAGIETAHLLPLPRTNATLDLIIKHIKTVKAYIDIPFYLENITYYFDYHQNTLAEVDFINTICAEAQIGLLLDIENLRLNALNHHYNPYEFIKRLLPGCVKCIHMAGGSKYQHLMLDTHDHKISDELMSLLSYTLIFQHPTSIILERDGRLDKFTEVVTDCKKIKHAVNLAYREAA